MGTIVISPPEASAVSGSPAPATPTSASAIAIVESPNRTAVLIRVTPSGKPSARDHTIFTGAGAPQPPLKLRRGARSLAEGGPPAPGDRRATRPSHHASAP